METKGIILQTLIFPCACHCRYCLLSWDGKTVGADYDRCEAYAKRFHEWVRANRPEWHFLFSFGYCMEHPRLFEAVDFLNSIGSPTGKFLQMDGMRFRSETENRQLMEGLKAHGMELINFTFYGLEPYHDRFAGRAGDYAHMMGMIDAARKANLSVSAGIPLTSQSAPQIGPLIDELESHGISQISLFVPSEEGRGITLSDIRFTVDDFDGLEEDIKRRVNRKRYRSEAEWVTGKDFETENNRSLIISLMPENIDRFERMLFEDVIGEIEKLDEQYYSVIPSLPELAERYGEPAGRKIYRQRDLFAHYQKMYIKENGLHLYDVTDERQCGSRRY